jgi:hypothetical protein
MLIWYAWSPTPRKARPETFAWLLHASLVGTFGDGVCRRVEFVDGDRCFELPLPAFDGQAWTRVGHSLRVGS